MDAKATRLFSWLRCLLPPPSAWLRVARVLLGEAPHARPHASAGEEEPLLPQLTHLDAAPPALEHQRERRVVIDAHLLQRVHEETESHPFKLWRARTARMLARLQRGQAGFKKSAPSGGSFNSSDCCRPWLATACERTVP